jgi:hypothetical protein
MFVRSLLISAIAATSFSALATLAPLDSTEWPPVLSTGLSTVLFNRDGGNPGETFVALGAHAYKNGPSMPSNDGISLFEGAPGLYLPDLALSPPLRRANWSFDFSYNVGNCSDCSVILAISGFSSTGSYSASVDLSALVYTTSPLVPPSLVGTKIYGNSGRDSWNLEMDFFNSFLGVDFDPFSTSNTEFALTATSSSGGELHSTEISVDVDGVPPTNNVPEPGTLALVGLALAGIGVARRRGKSA